MVIPMLLGFVFIVLPLIATVEAFFQPWRPDNLVSMSIVVALAAWVIYARDHGKMRNEFDFRLWKPISAKSYVILSLVWSFLRIARIVLVQTKILYSDFTPFWHFADAFLTPFMFSACAFWMARIAASRIRARYRDQTISWLAVFFSPEFLLQYALAIANILLVYPYYRNITDLLAFAMGVFLVCAPAFVNMSAKNPMYLLMTGIWVVCSQVILWIMDAWKGATKERQGNRGTK